MNRINILIPEYKEYLIKNIVKHLSVYMKLRNIDRVDFVTTFPSTTLVEASHNNSDIVYRIVTARRMRAFIKRAFLWGDRRYVVLGFDTGCGDYTEELIGRCGITEENVVLNGLLEMVPEELPEYECL